MKLTFKDLKQQKFVIEAEPSETIGEVKEKISKEKGWEANQQKLIYSGKILQDVNTVESYHIEEKGFIVCMTSKPKAAAASNPAASSSANPPSTPAPQVANTPAPPAAPAPALNPTTNAPSTPTPAAPLASGISTEEGNFNDPSALTLGPQRDAVTTDMESMGFSRANIDRAMRAAFYNPNRAVEYLLNGIPEDVQQEQQSGPGGGTGSRSAGAGAASSPAPAAGNTSATADPSTDAGDQPVNLFEAAAQAGRGGSSGGAARPPRQASSAASGLLREGLGAGAGTGAGAGANPLGNLDFLRNNSQFQQLRSIVQTQPQMLEPILQQVGAGNPHLAQLIGQNPDQFLQLLSEESDGDVPLPPGAQEISVTEEERAAIERLCLLGFERDRVIQAYFACDKNEELAANFLFEQPDNDDDA
ncbi:hypothetical protein MMC29_007401, partial [Sticta canariensis]|nr:hypothetical protein [Sticta canariensis]